MEPIILIVIFFVLSLSAAFILFKWLDNSAVVNTPFGKFGGAIAGFIGVYLLLHNSYSELNENSSTKSLDLPNSYNQYISDKWKFGFGYSKGNQFSEWRKREIVGSVGFGPEGNISFSVEELDGNELQNLNKSQAIVSIIDKQLDLIKNIHREHEVLSMEDYSIGGVSGKVIKLKGKLRGKDILTTLIIIPHFELNNLYFFDLTTTEQSHDTHLTEFNKVISTVKYM
ncbi:MULTISPECIES: hypothetical protein [unclassified Shewanella]|uniref:hypothetical protein n=1 Tax=unclassified Shewanella TaxID=196818 RepID=UPI00355155D9